MVIELDVLPNPAIIAAIRTMTHITSVTLLKKLA